MYNTFDRRTFLRATAIAAASPFLCAGAEPAKETYENHATGLRIVPGAWRPHYPWEHIGWISPSWPSQDYIWLDFPEAIFTDRGLIYLSHVNPAVPAVYAEWPRVEWEREEDGIRFTRTLPDGVEFSGAIRKERENVAGLTLRIRNGSEGALRKITLQTCAFLRAIREFADYTADNKYVHVKDKGWMRFKEAAALSEETGRYGLGWRTHANRKADLPVMVTVSTSAERLVAMTWGEATLSMTQNSGHPCMHCDPEFRNLEAGEEQTVKGRLIFFEGGLEDFRFEDYA